MSFSILPKHGFESHCCGPLIPGALTALGVSAGTAATIGTVVSVGSTILSLGSALFKSKAQQADYSGQVAASKYNAKVAQDSAAITDTQTAAAVEAKRRETYLRAGAQRAAAGANNTGFGGSTGDILADNATQNELDILNTQYEGNLKSKAYLDEAGLDTLNAKTTKKTAKLSQGASILSGVAKLGGNSIV